MRCKKITYSIPFFFLRKKKTRDISLINGLSPRQPSSPRTPKKFQAFPVMARVLHDKEERKKNLERQTSFLVHICCATHSCISTEGEKGRDSESESGAPRRWTLRKDDAAARRASSRIDPLTPKIFMSAESESYAFSAFFFLIGFRRNTLCKRAARRSIWMWLMGHAMAWGLRPVERFKQNMGSLRFKYNKLYLRGNFRVV